MNVINEQRMIQWHYLKQTKEINSVLTDEMVVKIIFRNSGVKMQGPSQNFSRNQNY
jgi:hypothetical protein